MAGRTDPSPLVSTRAGRVLVAEDDGFFRSMLEERLRDAGHEVECVTNGADAWDLLENKPYEVLLADWMMPAMDGYELCRRVKASSHLQDLYCVLLTTKDRVEDAAQALDDGADDFLVKPCDEYTLAARVRTGLRVSRLYGRLDAVARRDALTGTYHAGSLDERLFEEIARAQRFDHPLSLVLVELDGLAEINDTFGHGVGDEVLASAGERILARIRSAESAVRAGGDEFVLVLPNTDIEGARVVANDIERIIGQIQLPRSDVPPYGVFATASCAQLADGFGVNELMTSVRSALSDYRQDKKRERLRSMAH